MSLGRRLAGNNLNEFGKHSLGRPDEPPPQAHPRFHGQAILIFVELFNFVKFFFFKYVVIILGLKVSQIERRCANLQKKYEFHRRVEL